MTHKALPWDSTLGPITISEGINKIDLYYKVPELQAKAGYEGSKEILSLLESGFLSAKGDPKEADIYYNSIHKLKVFIGEK